MEFQKATIEPEGGDSFQVLFNPTQYNVEKTNEIAEAAIPGLEAPILQYVHGNTRTLGMELFFDTYEEQTDVTQRTNQIYNLLLLNQDTHVPPICRVSWGSLSFEGVLASVSGAFTLFLSNGTPVRATLTVSFKEYIKVNVLVQARPTRSSDHRKTRVVRFGDRISNIAYEEYGDARKWRPIAEVNRLDNPLQLTPGFRLVIPALDASGKVKHA